MQKRKNPWSVGQWMTANPRTAAPGDSARDTFFRMRVEGVRHMPVVSQEDGLIGIITDRDLRRPDISSEPDGWMDFYNLDDGYEIGDLMTHNPKTVRVRDSIDKALSLLVSHRFGALPVLNKDGMLIGIFTSHDAMRAGQASIKALAELKKG